MGKEANLRHKTRKTSVLLYRAFLKLSLAGAIYATYLVLRGSTIAETGFAVAVSLVRARAFYRRRSRDYLVYGRGNQRYSRGEKIRCGGWGYV